MVSVGSTDSDRRHEPAFGRLGVAIAVMALILVAGLGFRAVARISFERGVAQQATNECSKSRDKAGCQSGVAEIRSALAAEHAVQLGIWQTAFNFFGLIGLFFTVVYAKRAWEAASSSAKADNEALELTREALKEQREGAAEQAQMTLRQIAASEQLAVAARRQAEVARKAYIAADRPWIGIKVIHGAVDIRPDIVVVTLTTRYTNIGKGPALHVQPEVIALGEGHNIGTDGFGKAVEAALFFPIGESLLPGEHITIPQDFLVCRGPGAAEKIAQSPDGVFHFSGCVGTKYFSPSGSDRFISARNYSVSVKRTSLGRHGPEAVEFRERLGHFT